MSIFNLVKKSIKKTRLVNLVRTIRWKKVKKQFDTSTQKFKNIDHTAKKIAKKYGEDVYDQLAQRYVYNYMSQYNDEIGDTIQKLKEEIKPTTQPFTIFTMWWQGEKDMPPLVKTCINSFKRIDGKVIIITKDNYSDYVSLPEYIIAAVKNDKMSLAHFSDIVRTYVIIKFGGVWIDSTVFIANKIPDYMTKSFFVFKQSPQLRECRSYGNWWIASPPGNNILIEELAHLYCYWKHHDVAMHYYIYHIFFRKIIDNNAEYKKLIDAIPTRIADSAHFNFLLPFNEELWSEIKKISPVFKCSYKTNVNLSQDSFYSRLYNNRLD